MAATTAHESWAAHTERTARSWEARYLAAAQSAFAAEERLVLAVLDATKARKADGRAGTPAWQQIAADVDAAYSTDGAALWTEALDPLYQEEITDHLRWLGREQRAGLATEDTTDERDAEWVLAILGGAWLAAYSAQVAALLIDTSARQMGHLWDLAQRDGWSLSQGRRQAATVFRQWREGDVASVAPVARLPQPIPQAVPPAAAEVPASTTPPAAPPMTEGQRPDWRAKTVSENEPLRALNAVTQEALPVIGWPYKLWWTTLDGRERETHRAAHGQRVPVAEPFIVGGTPMRWPHDPSAPASETTNCRCSLIGVKDKEGAPPA